MDYTPSTVGVGETAAGESYWSDNNLSLFPSSDDNSGMVVDDVNKNDEGTSCVSAVNDAIRGKGEEK